MPIIVIKNMGEKAIGFKNSTKTLLKHLQDNYIDWMHACGGKGKCTTCKVRVLQGAENLDVKTVAEERFTSTGELAIDERLSCQCVVLDDVTVYVPKEVQLPHVKYTE